MNMFTKSKFEAEANEFAADLIYKGDIFTIESNSMDISFKFQKNIFRINERLLQIIITRMY